MVDSKQSNYVSYVKERFNTSATSPGYQEMTKNTKVVGVWDDHDYGKNDAGLEWEAKDTIRDIFLDFVGESDNSERRL